MKSSVSIFPLVFALGLAGCTGSGAEAPSAALAASAAPAAAAETAPIDAQLVQFLDAAFDAQVALSPESMTALGLKRDYNRLDDYTLAGAERAQRLAEEQLQQMKARFDYQALSPSAQLSYRLFERDVEQGRRQLEWRTHRFPVSNNGSPMGGIPVFLINQHRVDSAEDAEAYIARLVETERVMNEVAARVREQAKNGIVPPEFIFDPVREDGLKVIAGAPFDSGADSTVLADFRKKVDALQIPAAEKTRLLNEASAALTGPFKRGYDVLLAALAEIRPLAKGNDGAWSLPEGEAFYENQLNYYTTTDLSAEQIHQTGLREVERIHGEMREILERVGFEGSLQDFFQYVKTDPRFNFEDSEAGKQAYLAQSRELIAQVMAKAPQYFHRLPEAELEVRAVEPWREETASVAFYNRPAPDGSRPGIYYVNLADMTQVLKPQIEGIAYHEGAPGHHFQIAFAQEIEGMPKFRQFGYYGAYTEGWGLYAEKLAKEMGFYEDPYSEFGKLSLELWRATRLVTDTGMHAKRWSREQAIDYFKENTLLSDRDIVKEVERYISNPGQATSYKIGELKIMELREKARTALGDGFDIRDFHRAILGNGALPLDVLEAQVDAYIAETRAA